VIMLLTTQDVGLNEQGIEKHELLPTGLRIPDSKNDSLYGERISTHVCTRREVTFL
jgi:hypothetical protein